MNDINHSAIIAAGLATPEDDVNVPARRKSTSFNAQVAELSIGETASRANRIDESLTVAQVRAAIAEMKTGLRNNLKKVAQRAAESTGGEFSVEVTDVTTSASNWYLLGLITRIA